MLEISSYFGFNREPQLGGVGARLIMRLHFPLNKRLHAAEQSHKRFFFKNGNCLQHHMALISSLKFTKKQV